MKENLKQKLLTQSKATLRKPKIAKTKILQRHVNFFAKFQKIKFQKLVNIHISSIKDGSGRVKKVAVFTYNKRTRSIINDHFNIHIFDASLSKSKRHTELTKAGPFDMIIDLGGPNNRHITLLHTFYHLLPGGIYVIPNGVRELDDSWHYSNARNYLRDVIRIQSKNRPKRVYAAIERNNPKRYQMGLAWGISKVDVSNKDIVLTRSNADSVRIKLREYEMDRVQKYSTFKKYETITSIKPQPFEHKAKYNTYGHSKDYRLQSTSIAQNTLSLRKYTDVQVAPRQIIMDNQILLPDTFRHNSRTYLVNHALDDINPRAAALRFSTKNLPARLGGVYFYLDDEHRGHFGHLLTETISRIWGWPTVKKLHPEAKILVCSSKEFSHIPEYEYAFYEAAGIAREDIVLLKEPTLVTTLYSSAPLFSNPNYIHPEILKSWKLVGNNLARSAKQNTKHPERIFCSRKQSRRSCNNGNEIEELFKSHGFEIVYPEEYSLGEQVQMFRSAKVIAGYAGSSVFTVIFTLGQKHIIILRPNTYAAENEFLISALIGGTIDIIISEADDQTSSESSFTVDFDNEGADLVRILKELD